MIHLVELCAGTASVSLWALARVRPLTGYMGSKRQDAALLCTLLDARDPDRVTLVDAGPWGDVWTTLRDASGRRGVVACLRALDKQGTLPAVWPSLLSPPTQDSCQRAAQYLCLQSRSAGCIPIWWNSERGRWESPSGSRTETAHQRGGIDAAKRTKLDGPESTRQRLQPYQMGMPVGRKVGPLYRSHPARGIQRIATIAERVDALDRIDWSRVTVRHCDVGEVSPVPGSTVYFDPPYSGAPRYAALLPRGRVLEIATAHAASARLVVVSEAEPLPIDGWSARRLRPTGKPEWLTIHGAAHPAPDQLDFFGHMEGASP